MIHTLKSMKLPTYLLSYVFYFSQTTPFLANIGKYIHCPFYYHVHADI